MDDGQTQLLLDEDIGPSPPSQAAKDEVIARLIELSSVPPFAPVHTYPLRVGLTAIGRAPPLHATSTCNHDHTLTITGDNISAHHADIDIPMAPIQAGGVSSAPETLIRNPLITERQTIIDLDAIYLTDRYSSNHTYVSHVHHVHDIQRARIKIIPTKPKLLRDNDYIIFGNSIYQFKLGWTMENDTAALNILPPLPRDRTQSYPSRSQTQPYAAQGVAAVSPAPDAIEDDATLPMGNDDHEDMRGAIDDAATLAYPTDVDDNATQIFDEQSDAHDVITPNGQMRSQPQPPPHHQSQQRPLLSTEPSLHSPSVSARQAQADAIATPSYRVQRVTPHAAADTPVSTTSSGRPLTFTAVHDDINMDDDEDDTPLSPPLQPQQTIQNPNSHRTTNITTSHRGHTATTAPVSSPFDPSPTQSFDLSLSLTASQPSTFTQRGADNARPDDAASVSARADDNEEVETDDDEAPRETVNVLGSTSGISNRDASVEPSGHQSVSSPPSTHKPKATARTRRTHSTTSPTADTTNTSTAAHAQPPQTNATNNPPVDVVADNTDNRKAVNRQLQTSATDETESKVSTLKPSPSNDWQFTVNTVVPPAVPNTSPAALPEPAAPNNFSKRQNPRKRVKSGNRSDDQDVHAADVPSAINVKPDEKKADTKAMTKQPADSVPKDDEFKIEINDKEPEPSSLPSRTKRPPRRKTTQQQPVATTTMTSDTKARSRTSSTTSNASSSRASVPHVLVTGIIITDTRWKTLGAIETDNASEVTHLVTDKVRRTDKFLCSYATAQYILQPSWIHASCKAQKFVEEQDHLLIDIQAENQYGFKLNQRRINYQFLNGYRIYLTDSVEPPITIMRHIIEACGGTLLTSRNDIPKRHDHKSSKASSSSDNHHILIISSEKDETVYKRIARDGYDIYNRELILSGALKQTLDFDQFLLHSESHNNNTTSSSAADTLTMTITPAANKTNAGKATKKRPRVAEEDDSHAKTNDHVVDDDGVDATPVADDRDHRKKSGKSVAAMTSNMATSTDTANDNNRRLRYKSGVTSNGTTSTSTTTNTSTRTRRMK